MHVDVTTLKNGLRIITSTRPEIESVSLGIWVKTGSACEKPEVNGISHFLEHMAFKGTQRRTARQISDEIENTGGQSNAYTSREITSFYAKMLKNDTELAVDVLTDILLNSAFPEEELVKERDVVIQEIKQTLDTPDDIIFDYFQEKAYPDQALGRTILGPQQNVRRFSRDTLLTYKKSNYAAENTVVCAVGNVIHDQFVKMVESRMSGYQPQTDFAKDKQIYKGGFYCEERNIEQAHAILGFQGMNYISQDYYPCILMSTVLGGGMSSRLFQEIREKHGLAYSVYSFSTSQSETGTVGIYVGTDPADLKKLMPLAITEIQKICNEKVTKQELDRAKIQLKASMLMSLESSSATVEILARQSLIYGRLIPIEEMVARIESVTVEDIQRAAQTVFASNPTYTLLGAVKNRTDYDEVQQLLSA